MKENFIPKCNRKFQWISSIHGDPDSLLLLSKQMMQFYSHVEARSVYQEMLDTQEDIKLSLDSVRHLMPNYICELGPSNVLEVGCGDGRAYRQLLEYGFVGSYTGVDVAEYITTQNSQRHPKAVWKCACAYTLPFPNNTFEVCYSLYVLEHLVYPEKALSEMLRVVKSRGRLVLVFPDFVTSGRFASQFLGLSPMNSAKKKLYKWRIVDALLSLYDSRIRLPRALKSAIQKHGKFPVNMRPLCLSYPTMMEADVDAVYIASKLEVHEWAISNGLNVAYPCGTTGEFAAHAFMVITKL
jgi:ubiquinone/menaquinone biosynthesis C-methylase UbiE